MGLCGRRHGLAALIAFWVAFASPVSGAAEYVVSGQRILHDGEDVQLFGVSWFGAETRNYVVHGLWARNYQDMIYQIASLGFNAIRMPVCPMTLADVTPTSINYSANPSLQGLGSLEVLDVHLGERAQTCCHVEVRGFSARRHWRESV